MCFFLPQGYFRAQKWFPIDLAFCPPAACSGTLLSASAIMLSSGELRLFILDGERITACQNVIGQAKFPSGRLSFKKPL